MLRRRLRLGEPHRRVRARRRRLGRWWCGTRVGAGGREGGEAAVLRRRGNGAATGLWHWWALGMGHQVAWGARCGMRGMRGALRLKERR